MQPWLISLSLSHTHGYKSNTFYQYALTDYIKTNSDTSWEGNPDVYTLSMQDMKYINFFLIPKNI